MARIAIVGAGFGGLSAVRALRRQDPRVAISLVAPAPEFVYYPGLIWVPTGLRQGPELRRDVRGFLARQRVDFHAARVTGLADGGRRIATTTGELECDALIVASGAQNLQHVPGIGHTLTLCDGLGAAGQIRDRLALMDGGRIAFGFAGNPQDPSAVRGGPMFELLFGIDTHLRRRRKRDAFDLVFFSPAAGPENRLGQEAMEFLRAEMVRRNIRTHLGHPLTGFTSGKVLTEGGSLEADLILFMPGLAGPDFAAGSGLPLAPGGFFQADARTLVPGFPGVFVAGDAGAYAGSPDWLPRQAHMAELQAAVAAHNALRHLHGEKPDRSFRNELLCILDSLDGGTLIYRTPSTARVVQGSFWHLAKRMGEWRYRLRYRENPSAGENGPGR